MSTSFSERSPLKFLSTPSARRATGGIVPGDITVKFLSTPSARRATIFTRSKITNTAISIHALREEGDADGPSGLRAGIISIHALREEGDPCVYALRRVDTVFLSTPSARRATRPRRSRLRRQEISIHALREEGDTLPTSR